MSGPGRAFTLAHFHVERRLATGGMAEVFLARKEGAEGTSKLLVVKRILPDYGTSRRFRSMFIEEAQLATRLNHPNLVQVYEFFDAGPEGHVLAMEYVDGPDLGELMRAARARNVKIGPFISAWICAEAAKGLHYAHEKKDEEGRPLEIVHRDVSPQNVLISYDGVVKITDFGIASARLVEEEDGVIKGKYGYMSPEQARGEKVDRRSDLYSLGVILWECLTGRALHGGLGGEALLDIVRSGIVEPPSLLAPDIPPELETIVLKLLAKDREDRYATGRELAGAIGRVLLSRQELVDAGVLEHRIQVLAPERERQSSPPHSTPEEKTQAAAPAARSIATSASQRPSMRSSDRARDPKQAARARDAREVRHVVLLSLRLELDAGGAPSTPDALVRAADARALERLRRMLSEMAYKRGLRWVWKDETHAEAIAGLSPKHARAPFDAAQLTRETHEALEGYADEVSSGLYAAISMVRGIATGLRDREGNLVSYVVHEPAPKLAALVSRATRAGSTLVAGGLYRLVRKDFVWGAADEIPTGDDSGAPRTMKVHELIRALSREERRADGGGGNDLVGRDAERADLSSAFHQASKDGGKVVVRAVVGELGIGKTALVSSFAADLPERVQLIRVECTPVNLDVPYSATAEFVRAALDLSGEEPFETILERVVELTGIALGDPLYPTITRLAELAAQERLPQPQDEDGQDARRVLAQGLTTLLETLGCSGPVVLVLESFQWADRQSLDLFTDVLVPDQPLPLLALIVTRPEDRVARLLEGKVRVELSVLTSDDQVRLVEQRLGVTRGVREVSAEILPRAGGNPFFLLEMIDALLERGKLEIQEEAAPVSGPDSRDQSRNVLVLRMTGDRAEHHALPETLEQLLGDRVAELPADERHIVDILAVNSGPMTLEAISSLSRTGAQEALGRVCARGLGDQRGHLYDFRHPLMRDVVYAALDARTRRRMHEDLGEYLATTATARGAQAAIVARHFLRAELPERAAQYYIEAAETARYANQVPLALKHFERALACLARPRSAEERELRLRTLDGLETLYRMTGQREQRIRTLRELGVFATALHTPRAAALALLRRARYDLDASRLVRGVAQARMAAQLATDTQLALTAIEAESLLSELLRESGDVQGALAACDRAWAACDPNTTSGVSARTRAEVLTTRGVLLRRLGRVREAVDAYADAIAYARKGGAKRLEARASNALAYAMFVQGRYEDAVALGMESISLDLATGGRFQIGKTLTNIGQSYARLGQRERAEAYLVRAQQAHERYSDLDGHADMLVVRAEIAIEYEQLDLAEQYVAEAERINRGTANAYDRTHTAVARAALLRITGNATAAADLALSARREAEQQALVAFHFAALAVEASARVDMGELHSGTLLATTALGAVETLQGCEYGLEIRMLCAAALRRAKSPQAQNAAERAREFAIATLATIRDPRLAQSFANRPYVVSLLRSPVPSSFPRGDERGKVKSEHERW